MVRKGKEPSLLGDETMTHYDKTRWNYGNTTILIDVLTKAVQFMARNEKIDRFDLVQITKDFKERSGYSFPQDVIKNKYDNMKKDWTLWNSLRKQTDVGMDPVLGTIQASEEWWEASVKANKNAARFKDKPLQFADELEVLFTTSYITTGHTRLMTGFGFPPGNPFDVEDGRDVEFGDEVHTPEASDDDLDDTASSPNTKETSTLPTPSSVEGSKRGKTSSNRRSKKRKSGDQTDLASQSLAYIASSPHSNSRPSEAVVRPMDSLKKSFAEVNAVLKEMKLSPEVFVFACNLCMKEDYRALLLTMDVEDKRIYLELQYQNSLGGGIFP